MKILVTGATGFIGSHFCVAALEQGFDLVLLDNLENSKPSVVNIIEKLANHKVAFEQVDIRDAVALNNVFEKHTNIDAVVHFAGYKAVGESTAEPLMYYHNNVFGTINLLEAMQKHDVSRFLFSSSATVYGAPEHIPIKESQCKKPFNPYGQTKSVVEDMLSDLCISNIKFSAIALRYFNPIGAHPSGEMGEDPKGMPNNLMPYITKVAIGELKELGVFGNDYDTVDGTGVRDYIHVMDLAAGHVKALTYLTDNTGFEAINLGAGVGYSVLEVVAAFEKENQISIPYNLKPRRDGDVAESWADASKALSLLGWKTEKTLADMVKDSWHWQSKNPTGY